MKLITKLEVYILLVFSFVMIPAIQSFCKDHKIKVALNQIVPGEPKKPKNTDQEFEQFLQKIDGYKKTFPKFVSKVQTAQTVTSYLPEWATNAINWGLEKCGSPYKLDTKEMDFLQRFFNNKPKNKLCINSPERIIDEHDIKEIFEKFNETSGEFNDFKGVLKQFTIKKVPNVEDPIKRKKLKDKEYYPLVTTNFFATHLYDQGFRI